MRLNIVKEFYKIGRETGTVLRPFCKLQLQREKTGRKGGEKYSASSCSLNMVIKTKSEEYLGVPWFPSQH